MSKTPENEPTPLMRQYLAVRRTLPDDTILFYRLGDFYEMFFDDAVRAAPILGVVLTKRAGAPLCGVPYHAVDSYIAKVVRAGLKVAICEQMEDPATAKGVIRREIIRIETPGTVTEDSILDARANNYIASISKSADGRRRGLAVLELSTGEFIGESHETARSLEDALLRYSPAECIVPAEARRDGECDGVLSRIAASVTEVEDWTFQPDAAEQELVRRFGTPSLEGFGLTPFPETVCAAGALLRHVAVDLRRNVSHITGIRFATSDEALAIDETTCLNLDIVPMRGRPREITLLGVLDATLTPMGARALATRLKRPFGRLADINRSHDAVAWLVSHRIANSALRSVLGSVRDLERLMTRIGAQQGGGRELNSIAASLEGMPAIKAALCDCDDAFICGLMASM